MNLTEEMQKYRAPLVESLKDECDKMDKSIKKTDKDFINPKTAFKKKKGPFAKKEVKENTEIPDSAYLAGWNDALGKISDLVKNDSEIQVDWLLSMIEKAKKEGPSTNSAESDAGWQLEYNRTTNPDSDRERW